MERHDIQRLFKQHYAKMLRVARTILYDEQESKDVVSDIFEGLLTRLRMKVASPEQPSDAENEDERITDIVEFVVSHLTEQEQRIFCLRFTEGYSYEEIASTEGISRVAVWKHLSHALKEIRNRFNPKGL